jgi:hypothetical protein
VIHPSLESVNIFGMGEGFEFEDLDMCQMEHTVRFIPMVLPFLPSTSETYGTLLDSLLAKNLFKKVPKIYDGTQDYWSIGDEQFDIEKVISQNNEKK